MRVFAAVASLLAAAIWGFAFVVVKDSLSAVSAAYMMALRFTMAFFVLVAFLFPRLKRLNRRYLWNGVLIGVFLFFAYLLQTIGCNYTSPGKNAFFTTVYVILIPLYTWLVHKKRPALLVFVAAGMQVSGIGLLSVGSDIRNGISLSLGDWLTLFCAAFYCLQMFYQSEFYKDERDNDPVLYALVEFGTVAVLSWLFAPFYDSSRNCLTLAVQGFPVGAFASRAFVASMLYLGLGSTALAFVLQNVGLKYLPPALATILMSFESVFGMLFSLLIPVNGEREQLSSWGIAGCVLVFAAVLLAQRNASD